MGLLVGLNAAGTPEDVQVESRALKVTASNLDAGIGAVIRPGLRRLWQPYELEMADVGADNRHKCWRWITPDNSGHYSKQYPMEGCQDITLWISCGAVVGSTPTVTAALYLGMVGGDDYVSNQLNIAPTDRNQVTTSTSGTHLVLSSAIRFSGYDATSVTAAKNHLHGITALYWSFALTGSAAGVPVTVWALGR